MAQATGNLQRDMPHPFGVPTTSPFTTAPAPPNPFSQAPPSPPSPFAPAPSASPFAHAPPPVAAFPSFTQPPMPPMPDEIIIDTDLEFSLMNEAIAPTVGSGLPLPPGLPPPPALRSQPPPFPSPLAPPSPRLTTPPPRLMTPAPRLMTPPPRLMTPPPSPSALDAIFEGIDINVPTAPSQMSDPALEAGDFMIDSGPAEPPPSPEPAPAGSSDWAASSALGADLLAAFNASGPDEPALVMPPEAPPTPPRTPPPMPPSLTPPAFAPPPAFARPAPPPIPEIELEMSFEDAAVPLTQRLSLLAGRLREEGRLADADLVTEAMATINLG